jgi:lysozyme-related protein Hpa2
MKTGARTRNSALSMGFGVLLGALVHVPAHARNPPVAPDAAIVACVDAASTRHGINPDLLLAILRVESGLRADPVRRNQNGSIDVGIAQINSIHFPTLRRHGIEGTHLLDPCVGIHVAAWHLKNQILRHGNTWFAVGAYHSATPHFNQLYQGRVARELRRMGKLAP